LRCGAPCAGAASEPLRAGARRAFVLDEARTPGAAAAPGEQRQPGGASAACEELLVDMWRRRSAVEHALRVASELYTEAEAAAMQAYTQAQRRAGVASPQPAWWKEPAPAQGPTLTPAQRDEARLQPARRMRTQRR
jgi:hypothetical protein